LEWVVKSRFLGLLALSICLMAGCGPGGPATIPVTGKVTKGGAGLPNVRVTLVDTKNAANISTGTSDANGDFTLFYGAQGKQGAVPGKYKVVLSGGGTGGPTITMSADGKSSTYGGGNRQNQGKPVVQLPYDEKWTRQETTPQEVEVKSGMAALEVKVD
jgi:hypothetical protein